MHNGKYYISPVGRPGVLGWVSQRRHQKRALWSRFQPNRRVVRFKIPRGQQPQPIRAPPSDSASTWEMVQTLLPHDRKSIEPANDHESHVIKAFGHRPDDLLSVPPLKHLLTPFAYHSAINGDHSYISQPRLSVSKLLTDAWCELRSFYAIYAGSPRSPPSSSMKAGTKYHAKLETDAYQPRDEISLKAKLKELLAVFPVEIRQELTKTKDACKFAQSWVDQTVFRTICASQSKVARELFIHGFLDLKKGALVSDAPGLKHGVLVNGIADIVKIDTSNASTSYDDAAASVSEDVEKSELSETPVFSPAELLDLSVELPAAKHRMASLATEHYLHMRDVKTRRSDTIPAQASAVNGAKIQCMYYAVFLHNLSRSASFAYASCVENIRRRGIDPDEPLSIALAVELLVANFRTLAVDCVRLARGEPIGFEEFDEFVEQKAREYPETSNSSENSENSEQSAVLEKSEKSELSTISTISEKSEILEASEYSTAPKTSETPEHTKIPQYSFSQFISEDDLRSLVQIHYGDDLDIQNFDLRPLFENWKCPLTLRYIAARTGQAFNVYEPFEPASVCVEYHNSQKHTLIARMHYPYNADEIQNSIAEACTFWNGQRRPTHTEDPSMCTYCTFNKRCSAINSGIEPDAAKRIQELQST